MHNCVILEFCSLYILVMWIVETILALFLICTVNGACPDQPEVQQCMNCATTVNCVPLFNCTLPSSCTIRTCSLPYFVCLTFWRRDAVGTPWIVISDYISPSSTLTTCDFNETCIDPRDMEPTVEVGQFDCRCRGHLCNRNFLAGSISPMEISSEVQTGSTTPRPSSTVILMTPSATIATALTVTAAYIVTTVVCPTIVPKPLNSLNHFCVMACKCVALVLYC